MQKKESLPYQTLKFKTQNLMTTNHKGQNEQDDQSLITSPRSNIDLVLDVANGGDQFIGFQVVPILSQSSFDSSNNIDKEANKITKVKKRINNGPRLSLAYDYKHIPSEADDENQNFKENGYDLGIVRKSKNLSYDKLYSSLSSSALLSQAQNQISKPNPLTQSQQLKNDNPFSLSYDYNEKKEFFRAIKFNTFTKKRMGNNSSMNASQNIKKTKSLKQFSQLGEGRNTSDKKNNQQNSIFPYIEQSPKDSESHIYSETPYQIEKVIKINAKPSSESSTHKAALNKQTTTNSLSQSSNNQKQLYIPTQFLTPQSKHHNSISYRSKVLSSFSDSLEAQQPLNSFTPLTTKEKKYSDRIQKIMSFNLAKEMSNIVSTIKKQKQKEQNPSILKLPSIKMTTLPISSDNQLNDKQQYLESSNNLTIQLTSNQNIQNLNKEISNKQYQLASAIKKKQVHFIIDDCENNI